MTNQRLACSFGVANRATGPKRVKCASSAYLRFLRLSTHEKVREAGSLLFSHQIPFQIGYLEYRADITMSFGFSVGDFIAAIELANKIRKDFVDAPSQFKGISDMCENLPVETPEHLLNMVKCPKLVNRPSRCRHYLFCSRA